MLADILSIHQLALMLVQVMDVCYHLRREGEGREGREGRREEWRSEGKETKEGGVEE